MKSMFTKRICSTVILAILGAGLLTGCSREKTEDYSTEGTAQEEQPQNSNSSGLAQFEGEEIWEDAVDVETEDGYLIDVHIDAKVSVPQSKEMSVIAVEAPAFDAGFKETLAKNIFDSYDADDYIGSRAGRLYRLSFTEEEGERCLLRQITLTPQNLQEVCPEKYKTLDDPVCSPRILGDNVENECEMSEEEALEEAIRFIQSLGLEYSVVSHVCPLVWSDAGGNSDEWSVNGYVFSFDLGVDGISFVDFGSETDYMHNLYLGYGTERLNLDIKEKTQCSLNARLDLYVTDQGVIYMTANNPQKITDVVEGVELLSLDTVKGILKNELETNWKSLRFSSHSKFFTAMELIYFRIQDKENPQKYSYVPAWRLALVAKDTAAHQISIRNPIFINAIDGSMIDYYCELYNMPPIEEQTQKE